MNQETSRRVQKSSVPLYMAIVSTMALTVSCGEIREGAESLAEPDPVQSAALNTGSAATVCYSVGGPVNYYTDSHYHYIYTTGNNTAAINCPLSVPNTVAAALLDQILYVDSNGGGVSCQLHSRRADGVDVYSKKVVSTRNARSITTTYPDGFKVTLWRSNGIVPMIFAPGAKLELQCILGPGAVFSEYRIAY